jgi:hypothetical protein
VGFERLILPQYTGEAEMKKSQLKLGAAKNFTRWLILNQS